MEGLTPTQERILHNLWAEAQETNRLLRQLTDLLFKTPVVTELKETEGCCMKGGVGESIPCVNVTNIHEDDDCCLSHSCPHHDGWLQDANGEWYDPFDPNDPRYRPDR